MEEVWKDIVGYEGLYQVSNLGRVKSLERYEHFGNTTRRRNETIIKQKTNRNGYKSFSICKNGERKSVLTHGVQAKAFLPNPNNYPCVNHKDENKENNFILVNEDGSINPEKSNLEWCSYHQNVTYGSRKPKKVLAYRDGELIGIFDEQIIAAKVLGLKFAGVSKCCRGVTDCYKGYVFRFQDCTDDIRFVL